jgi:imidazolonepropionase-like amidohydrolase
MASSDGALCLVGCRVLRVREAAASGGAAAAELGASGAVLVARGRVVAVAEGGADEPDVRRLVQQAQEVVQCGGLTLMPGLLDAHVHVTASSADLRAPAALAPSLVALRSAPILRGMLLRGFTTVRDCGGADWGIAQALAEGSIEGPTLLFCGKALSQTGGHGDFRGRGEQRLPSCPCCDATIGRVCDGDREVRLAVRDEVRKGATHIKIMASGGVASPTDRLANLQFSEAELAAVVEEARNAGIYVCAHAYTAEAVARAVRAGCASIEHGNLADDTCLELMRQRGCWLVPTLITYERLRVDGARAGMPQELVDKVGDLLEAGVDALRRADRAGVPVAYGSDLLGLMHGAQAQGIALHLRAQPPAAVLAALTVSPARLFRLENEVGLVAPGARADLLLVRGDVLNNPALLADEDNLRIIIKAGRIVKRM